MWYTVVIKRQSSSITHLWRRRGERIYSFYLFATSALDGVSGQRHASAALYPLEKDPGTHWTGGFIYW
jgi:hypothetical protein